MQTFLPFPDFRKSLECLDTRRLGKQRIEARRILDILLNRTTSKAWVNHPCTLMWRGYEEALKLYYNRCLDVWIKRGFKNNMKYEILNESSILHGVTLPPWLGNEDFHKSHRSNLLRKDLEFYRKYFDDVSDQLPYVWPVTKKEKNAAL